MAGVTADRPFLSDQWYRVSQLAPRLSPHLRIERRRGPGGSHYLVFDPLTGRSHRLSVAAMRLVQGFDGQTPLDETWRALVDSMGEAAPTQDETVRLLSQLHGQDLVQADIAPDIAERAERRGKLDRKLLKQNLMGPLSTQIPLFDPTPILALTQPLVRPLLGPVGLCLWLALLVYAGALALADSAAIAGAISDQVWTAGSIATVAGTYVLMKALHELGHGWVARRHGVAIPEFGIMLLVFMPVPYVDATETAKLDSRWARASVSAAGIIVETALAAVAFLLWREADPGPWRALLFNVMLVGGVSTVLVNGNPLLKFDGYFVMTDLLGLPNLAQRANRAWGDWVNRHVFGARDLPNRRISQGEALAFAVYAPAAFVYRVLLSLWIGLYVASHFFLLGLVLALWSLTLSLLRPVGKGLWHVYRSPLLRRTRARALGLTLGGAAAVALFLTLVPLPHASWTQGVVRPPEGAAIVASAEGRIEAVHAEAGATVAAGAPLMSLADPLEQARARALEARLDEAALILTQARLEGPGAARLAEIGRDDARAALDRERASEADRTLRAGVDGRFRPLRPPRDLVGRHVRRGTLLGHVLPGSANTVRLVALQAQAAAIERGVTRVEIRLPGRIETHAARFAGRVSTGGFDLPSPLLARSMGGPVPAVPEGQSLRPTERVFVYDARLPPDLDAPIGGRAQVKLVHPWRPLAPRWIDAARRALSGRIVL